jgi:1-acyl-sn-glycerol-3-phosphate acyltransferase
MPCAARTGVEVPAPDCPETGSHNVHLAEMLDTGKNSWFVGSLRSVFYLAMRILFRIEHRGWERIPARGPLLIVANHVTYFDPFWIGVRVYRTLRFMAWDKIFYFPLSGRLFRWLGAFPVNLENPEYGSYKTALKALRDGECVMIFPEGGRSPDGKLMPFKEGAAHLAFRAGAAVMPVVVRGGANVWSSQMLFPRPAKIIVEYLDPIPRERFPSTAAELMQNIQAAMLGRLEQPSDAETMAK